ncbi:putative sensor histidine kinase pdtaS [Kordia antarctica]|uniref:histidine kinase n=1 Tax=Kordia antarctica TaxID=1218801 RepID=A0A7L4ZHE4_9FLAO|nr:sensor histidine kinase [Kordia antarctica]QHI35344.1 putative sensor histidine kinase pdtaS [Kordia antarctica]
MFKSLKYYIGVFVVLAITWFLLHSIINNYEALEQQKIDAQLSKAHTDAMINAKAGIEVYATLVSSLKSYTKNSKQFPTEIQLQTYLNDFLKEIKFNDSILVNYIDTNHVFQYVITPQKIDPNALKGISVKSFLSQERVDELDVLMQNNTIKLFTPINLREGWAGFPFNFSVKNSEGEILGYMAPVLNVKYLLDYFYESNNQDIYVRKFLINDSISLTREAVYDGSEIFNTSRDAEYFENFNVKEEDFIYSTIQLFGLKLKVGSAYKKSPIINKNIRKYSYIWYGIAALLLILVLIQFLKNKVLNRNLREANGIVVSKNDELENSITNIQTLIKEIHHRVKNNMQMISGILTMQEDEYEDENVKSALRDSQNRIQSMSLVHEKLYGTDTLKDVHINEYVAQLILSIENTLGNKDLELATEIEIDEKLSFDGDTTANLGLMINELTTNSFKHGFKKDRKNSISISITKTGDYYKLIYKDSGDGLPDDFDFESTTSLGMQLIQILIEQLSGKFKYTRVPEKAYEIYFKPIVSSFTV